MVNAASRPPCVAERLREARERLGLSQRQIAETTKLSPQVLRALEDGRISLLPSGIYRRALIRTVAREVGLDPEAELRAFLKEHPDDMPMPGEQPVPVPVPRSSGWRKLLAVLGAVVPLLAGVAYFSWAGPAPRPEGPPAIARQKMLVSTAVVPVGGFGDLTAPLTRPVVMVLSVSARCQLRINVDGQPFMARVVEPGEQVHVEVGESVELSGSDAGAVQLSINGQAGRRLGLSGEPLSARIDRDDYATFLVSR